MTTPRDALQGMYDVLGRWPACRAGHTKGTFCAGTFTPSGEAAELTDAAHLQDTPVDVTVRFSRVVGNPGVHDGEDGICGMATRFRLRDGSYTDLIAVSLSRFTNRRPQDFAEMNHLCFKLEDGKTKQRPVGMLRFLRRHPDSLLPMLEALRTKPVPSYANCGFRSLNAFAWKKGEAQCFVRYSWVPVEGPRSIDKQEALERPSDYLQQDVTQRLGSKPPRPIRFRLQVQVASADDERKDRIVNPMKAWPEKGAQILTAGMLELTSPAEGPAHGHDACGFNPLNLTPGIEPSGDEILAFRHDVYGLAAADRMRPVPRPGMFQSQ